MLLGGEGHQKTAFALSCYQCESQTCLHDTDTPAVGAPLNRSCLPRFLLQGYLAHKTPPPLDPTAGLCLGPFDDPKGVGVSYERGSLVSNRKSWEHANASPKLLSPVGSRKSCSGFPATNRQLPKGFVRRPCLYQGMSLPFTYREVGNQRLVAGCPK